MRGCSELTAPYFEICLTNRAANLNKGRGTMLRDREGLKAAATHGCSGELLIDHRNADKSGLRLLINPIFHLLRNLIHCCSRAFVSKKPSRRQSHLRRSLVLCKPVAVARCWADELTHVELYLPYIREKWSRELQPKSTTTTRLRLRQHNRESANAAFGFTIHSWISDNAQY